MTIDTALQILLKSTRDTFPQQRPMGRNAVAIGTPDRYVRVSLQINGTHDHYSNLDLSLYVDDTHRASERIRITDEVYWPPREQWSAPQYDPRYNAGAPGFYWAHDQTFYVCQPNIDRLAVDLTRIFTFWRIPQ